MGRRRLADDALALALARGLPIAEAAREAGMSEATVWRRRGEPAFLARVAALRSDLVERALGQLADGAAEAVGVLRAALSSTEGDGIRVRAATSLLDRLLALRTATELEARLTALEAAAAVGLRRVS